MADGLPPDPSDIPRAVPVPKRRWAISIVWIIPLVAALLGGWVVLHFLLQRGPAITIEFRNAEGLEAGKTKLRYKDVDIGTVKEIDISPDRSHVLVTAEMAKQSEGLLVEDTKFWVVRPRITLNSVSGLGTLLSGAYIGLDAGKSQTERRGFKGLETPPPIPSDVPGRRFVLHAEDIGSLYIGAPVYYRRVEVGSITAYKLDDDGHGVTLEIFINAPNDRFVTSNSRFWHASGIDVSVESAGIKVNTESLTSIIIGGISFQAPPDSAPGEKAASNAEFELYPTKISALKRTGQEVHTYLLYFKESLRGLSPGAQVDFHGIPLGEVRTVSFEYDREAKELRFPVQIDIYPERLRSRYRPGAPQMSAMERDPKVLLNRMVARGLRAQLKSGNLLTGQLYVALDFFPDAPKAGVDWDKTPPVLPTVSGPFEDLQQTLGSIVKKLDKVPLDVIGQDTSRALKSLNSTLQGANRLITQLDANVVPEMRGTLEQARHALGNAEQTLSTESPVQQNLQDTLTEVSRAARSLQTLADYLGRHPEALIRGKTRD
jgi:paraquat-inducible protein B